MYLFICESVFKAERPTFRLETHLKDDDKAKAFYAYLLGAFAGHYKITVLYSEDVMSFKFGTENVL